MNSYRPAKGEVQREKYFFVTICDASDSSGIEVKMKVFIAGSRTISQLDTVVLQQIETIITNGYTVLIGDSIGLDKAVQEYLTEKRYGKVKIYATNGIARVNTGGWEVIKIKINSDIKGFDFYAAKDLAMAAAADYGLMVWNGISKGTLNNFINMTRLGKKVLVYYTPERKFHVLQSMDDIEKLYIDH